MASAKDSAASPPRTRAFNDLFERWLKRRTRIRLPLTLNYRQIFILPTRFGWLLGLLMSAMLIGSLNFNNNLGLLTTFIVAGLSLNAMLLTYRNLRGIRIRNPAAAPVFAGQPATLRLPLGNDDGRVRAGIEIRQGGRSRTVSLRPESVAEADLPLPTSRRGWQAVGRVRIQTTHPLGLFRAWSWFRPAQSVLVWPAPAAHPPPLPRDGGDRPGRRLRPGLDGDDFYTLRAWREGDPLHRIAWKASQRHQTLLSREFRQERSPHVMLDIGTTPGRDIEQRISVVTAWVLQADDDNQLWTLQLGGRVLGPDRGEAHRDRCLRALAEL